MLGVLVVAVSGGGVPTPELFEALMLLMGLLIAAPAAGFFPVPASTVEGTDQEASTGTPSGPVGEVGVMVTSIGLLSGTGLPCAANGASR